VNLYNRKSLITAAPEGKPVMSYKPNVTKWVYFILVILLAAYLIYLLIKPYYIVESQGLVDVEARDVLAERDGMMLQVAVKEGQAFKKGDLLASFAAEKRCAAEPDGVLEKLSFDMQVLDNDIKALQREKAALAAVNTEPSATDGMLRALEVNASLFRQQKQLQQQQQQQLDKLNIEINKEQERLAIMSGRHRSLSEAKRAQPVAEACLEKHIYAGEDGQVKEVRVLSQDFAVKGRAILKYSPADAKVRVVFLADANLYRSFAQQSQLIVSFPDGAESLGRVEQIESVASQISGNLNDLLSKDKVQLRMTLVPFNPADSSLWRKYERLPVSVRGSL
jgi:multidrug resistance efflux pump